MPFEAHLDARPGNVTYPAPTGRHSLQYGSKRDSYFHVPANYDPARPCPLVLLLHGAGGHAHDGLELLQYLADDKNLILVAPGSTSHTWDVIVDRMYGPDVALIEQALKQVFQHYAVDPAHVAIGGFSDGASYALSLGLINGDLFSHVMAFSPGFIAPIAPRGKPRLFLSHGIRDDVLPVSACSRNIVPRLKQAGYDVTYHEFDGPHVVPPEIASKAVDWFLAG